MKESGKRLKILSPKIQLIILTSLVLGLALITSVLSPAAQQCSSPQIQQSYFYTLDSDYANCTNLQQFTAQIYFVLLFPFLITLPAGLIVFLWLGYRLLNQRRFELDDWKVLVFYIRILLILALCLTLFFTFGSAN